MPISKRKPVYVVDGTRTPFLKAQGKPGPFKAADLAVLAGRELLTRMPFSADIIDEVILGCVGPGPDEANIARIVSLRLGCGEQTPAFTVQRNCASGMQAVDSAFKNIAYGYSDLILCGGTESMSHSPVLFNERMVHWLGSWAKAKTLRTKLTVLSQLRPAHFAPVIGLLRGLRDPVVGLSMGQTAEILAARFNLEKEDIDAFAVRSHQRLAAAIDAGLLNEVVAVFDDKGNAFTEDNGLRRNSSLENLAKLKPAFERFGVITAGNSAQITDGAALLMLASEKAVKQHQLPILGKIVDVEWAGLDPAQMGLGPAYAISALMKRRRMTMDTIDYWEINEAFAAQVMACSKALDDDEFCRTELQLKAALGQIPDDRLNVDGGGISLGHPVGASGTRIILHLLHTLNARQAKQGIASLCIGGGQGGATLVETAEQDEVIS